MSGGTQHPPVQTLRRGEPAVRERWEGKGPFTLLSRSGRLCACPQAHTGLNVAKASGNDWVKLVIGQSLKILKG